MKGAADILPKDLCRHVKAALALSVCEGQEYE